jgi:hypothetical protein
MMMESNFQNFDNLPGSLIDNNINVNVSLSKRNRIISTRELKNLEEIPKNDFKIKSSDLNTILKNKLDTQKLKSKPIFFVIVFLVAILACIIALTMIISLKLSKSNTGINFKFIMCNLIINYIFSCLLYLSLYSYILYAYISKS